MSDAALEALAQAAGVQVHWRDAAGAPKTVAPDSLRGVLTAMGLGCASAAEIAESRRRLVEQDMALAWRSAVATAGEPLCLPPGPELRAVLHREDGGREALTLEIRDGARSLTAPVGIGDHALELDGRVIPFAIAPRRAFTLADAALGRRAWGAAAQLYGLRGRRAAPFGDFTALGELVEALGAEGADALAVSPTHALFTADPGRCSPYAPSTRLFTNVLYADPAELYPGLAAEPGGGPLIDWVHGGRTRLAALQAAFARFRREASPSLRAELAAFRAEGGADLEGHARFEALHAHLGGGGWRDWPAAYHNPQGAAVEAFASAEAEAVDFHVFAQWRAQRGLAAAQSEAKRAGMAVGLVSDLAVGMDPGGSHAWSRPQDLLDGLSVGAPPDVFQPAGQDWGLATFSPHALRASGYAPFRATLRAAMRQAGGVRIDHAMGLRRLWLTPRGAGPGHGAYLSFPERELLALVALESHKAQAIVVGEDLGTVPEGFREATTARGVMGMRVLWFERAADQGFVSPALWDEAAMAMTTTHDLPTVAGWWRGRDIDWRAELKLKGAHADEAADRADRLRDRARLWSAMTYAEAAEGQAPRDDEAGPAVDAAVGFVACAACALAIVPLEDLLGLDEQPNLPGVVEGHPNWRRRLDAPSAALLTQPDAQRRLRTLRAARPRPPRA